MQRALQQGTGGSLDRLAAIECAFGVDHSGIDEVGVAYIQVEPEALLDGFCQHFAGIGFQVW
ncbi:hypothetical protein QSV36_18035 [Pseudomonas sp. BCRC 81390]|nr:hypothetical protein [Pseudomonas sp. BCRC 81390]MDM3887475.1 hypothetical protein [Pseudomonas sp. BCRC 81390]